MIGLSELEVNLVILALRHFPHQFVRYGWMMVVEIILAIKLVMFVAAITLVSVVVMFVVTHVEITWENIAEMFAGMIEGTFVVAKISG